MSVEISGIIAVRDGEATLAACLESIRQCAEVVVVVDDRTKDRSEDIAKQQGARVMRHTFTDFSDMKNYAIAQATKPWSFLIDADETLSPELQEELAAFTPGKDTAYRVPRKNFFQKKWLRYGGVYPDYQLRFFQTGKAHFTGIVHEQLEVQGSVGTLSGPLLHANYTSTAVMFAKVRQYAPLEGKDKPKSWLKAVFAFGKRFVGVYLLRKGFLDGIFGFVHAIALSYYQYLMYRPSHAHRSN